MKEAGIAEVPEAKVGVFAGRSELRCQRLPDNKS
jgi:hypothetical protein